jgi:hypothetical protein
VQLATRTTSLHRVAWSTAAVAVILYLVGVYQIYSSACRPDTRATFAFLGLGLAIFSAGLVGAYALIVRSLMEWVAFVGALLLCGLMALGLLMLAVRCSGV